MLTPFSKSTLHIQYFTRDIHLLLTSSYFLLFLFISLSLSLSFSSTEILIENAKCQALSVHTQHRDDLFSTRHSIISFYTHIFSTNTKILTI